MTTAQAKRKPGRPRKVEARQPGVVLDEPVEGSFDEAVADAVVEAAPVAAAKRERLTENSVVYFKAKGVGNFVFESEDVEYLPLANGTNAQKPKPAVKIEFNAVGVSPPLNPKLPKEAALIARARKAIADHKSGVDIDERIDRFGFCELNPDGVFPPDEGWDRIDPAKLPALVEMKDLDVAKCIRYEELNQNRPALLAALDAMLNEPEEDVFASVEL